MEPRAIDARRTVAEPEPLRVGSVRATGLDRVWPMARPHIISALRKGRGEATEETILDQLLRGDADCLVVFSSQEILGAFIVVEIPYPTGLKVARVTHGGCTAPRDQWLPPLIKLLEEGCRLRGISRIEMQGRAGFLRLLRGYAEPLYVTMGREVQPYAWLD